MTDNNFNYKEIIEGFGEEVFNKAINYCRTIASQPEVCPSYFTDVETFMPHAWVVAAVAGVIGVYLQDMEKLGVTYER